MQSYLRDIPYAGVIQAVHEAMRRGFVPGDPSWINLGQGQPEIGDIPGGPARITSVHLDEADHGYGPVSGTPELRTKVAEHYNRLYRQGKASQYTAENVSITQGGRLALNRVLASLGEVGVGYMLPDYPGYEGLLGAQLARITPMPIRTSPDDGFQLDPADLTRLIDSAGIGAFLLSNPCNPTGAVLVGDQLDDLVGRARQGGCALVVDEFYSQFGYDRGPISAAAHVHDVNSDEVLIIDGLTKGFRYPGWRLGWVIGPQHAIEVLDKVGGGLDGGPSRLTQRAALAALDPEYADAEAAATRAEFARKRDLTTAALRDMGITVHQPHGTFYAWGCLEGLPAPLNTAPEFFRRALNHKVVTVPGHLFDVNPGGRRRGDRHFDTWMRFSYGPSCDLVADGLARLHKMIDGYR